MSIQDTENERPIDPSNEAVQAIAQPSRPNTLSRRRFLVAATGTTLGALAALSDIKIQIPLLDKLKPSGVAESLIDNSTVAEYQDGKPLSSNQNNQIASFSFAKTAYAQEDEETVAQATDETVTIRGPINRDGLIVHPNNTDPNLSPADVELEQRSGEKAARWLVDIRAKALQTGVPGLITPINAYANELNNKWLKPGKWQFVTITRSERTSPSRGEIEAGFSFPANITAEPFRMPNGNTVLLSELGVQTHKLDADYLDPNHAFTVLSLARTIMVFNRGGLRSMIAEMIDRGVSPQDIKAQTDLTQRANRLKSEHGAFKGIFEVYPAVREAVNRGILEPSPYYEEAFKEWTSLGGDKIEEFKFANRHRNAGNEVPEDEVVSRAS